MTRLIATDPKLDADPEVRAWLDDCAVKIDAKIVEVENAYLAKLVGPSGRVISLSVVHDGVQNLRRKLNESASDLGPHMTARLNQVAEKALRHIEEKHHG